MPVKEMNVHMWDAALRVTDLNIGHDGRVVVVASVLDVEENVVVVVVDVDGAMAAKVRLFGLIFRVRAQSTKGNSPSSNVVKLSQTFSVATYRPPAAAHRRA